MLNTFFRYQNLLAYRDAYPQAANAVLEEMTADAEAMGLYIVASTFEEDAGLLLLKRLSSGDRGT
jgi:hypothetical protein